MLGYNKNMSDYELQDICFDINLFLKDSFSVDDFLRNHRKATLEVMRNDLGTYLKILRLSMIELINQDYEDFINLSKDLVGLNAGIEVLQAPLDLIRSEIIAVKKNVEETIAGINQGLHEIEHVNDKKKTLLHLVQVLESIKKLDLLKQRNEPKSLDLDLIERASFEYTNLLFSAKKCQGILGQSQINNISNITTAFMNRINNTFLECLGEQNNIGINRCLRIFSNMDKTEEVESLIRKEVVAPFLYDLISEASLKKDPAGLKGIYQKVLDFVDTQLILLLNVSIGSEWNFLLNSLWTELAWRMEMHMSTIFAPGDPALFHSRYVDTCDFLSALQKRSKSLTVANFKKHPKTIHFMKKWNLLVYYKIRFQEIAGQLENAMCQPAESKSDAGYFLDIPATVKLCLLRCWDPQVYLDQLAHAFWQISLQILSRFCVWVREQSSHVTKANDEIQPTSDVSLSHLKFWTSLHCDAKMLSIESQQMLMSKVSSFQLSDQIKSNILVSLGESETQVNTAINYISERIVQFLVEKSVVYLSNVKDIPRLFRRTNRGAPTKPCEYVHQLVSPLTSFNDEYKRKVPEQILKEWLIAVFSEISRQYFSCVNDVLQNAQKTEDSLRRLKKAKDKSASLSDNKGCSDDDKIRLQLVVDVESFILTTNGLEIEAHEIPVLKDLSQLVEKAREKSERIRTD